MQMNQQEDLFAICAREMGQLMLRICALQAERQRLQEQVKLLAQRIEELEQPQPQLQKEDHQDEKVTDSPKYGCKACGVGLAPRDVCEFDEDKLCRSCYDYRTKHATQADQ